MAPGNVAACYSVSVSWVLGNLACRQRQWVAYDPQGKHLQHTHTHARTMASYSTHTFSVWYVILLDSSRKCSMNLTNIISLYGNPDTYQRPSNCNQNFCIVAPLGTLASFCYVNEKNCSVRLHWSSHFLRSNNITSNFLRLCKGCPKSMYVHTFCQ